MKQEVIQDFLNLPGIAGLALIDKRSRPYFCGIDQALNYQQKETLAQGILQVVDTIPEEFESFRFQFTHYQVHIHKLNPGMVLLVLTKSDLVYSAYKQSIKTLTIALRENMANAIATFRMLAGTTTLPGLNHAKASPQRPTLDPAAQSLVRPIISPETVSTKTVSPETVSTKTVNTEIGLVSAARDRPEIPRPSTHPASVSLDDLLTALNTLSQVTTQYLGTHVVVNYWKSTCPSHEWLKQFQMERSGQFSLIGATAASLQHSVSPQELLWVQEWIAAFITRCSQVIRDFPSLINQKVLTNEQKALLLG